MANPEATADAGAQFQAQADADTPARAGAPTPRQERLAQAMVQGLSGLSHRSRWWLARGMAALSLREEAVLGELLSTNLAIACPHLSPWQRQQLRKRNAQETFFALLDRFRIWNLSEPALRAAVTLDGGSLLRRHVGRQPVVLLCPHFLGMEAAAQRLTLEVNGMTLYRPSRSAYFDALRAQARQRFGHQWLFSTEQSLLPMIRMLRDGTPLFLLPDLDSGARGAIFSPFFGVPAATAPLAAWCALRANALLLPISVRREPDSHYVVRVHEPVAPLPRDIAQATHRVNAVIEDLVRPLPEQYWWAQPRYATRPPGARPLYTEAVMRHARESFGSAA